MISKSNFQKIYFTIFFSVLAVVIFFTVRTIFLNRNKKRQMDFAAEITRVQYLHGSSLSAFIDLSNGESLLLTFPEPGIQQGDSVYKKKGESFFLVRKSTGREVGSISLDGNPVRPQPVKGY